MDQRPDVKAKDSVTFLNQQTWFAPGAEEIAKKVNAELVYLNVERPVRGHYRFTFKEMHVPAEFGECRFPLTLSFFRMLEDNVKQQPELWLWSHNRWGKWDLANY
jgi:KDO2-lipid IV(A) lauroyltransferase